MIFKNYKKMNLKIYMNRIEELKKEAKILDLLGDLKIETPEQRDHRMRQIVDLLLETPEQRAERIFKEDEELQKQSEKQEFVDRQVKRQAVVTKHKDFIEAMIVGKPKGIISYLLSGATKVFNTDDEEYQYVGKFGRGAWNEYDIKKFKKNEQDKIVEIAREFGAFDY